MYVFDINEDEDERKKKLMKAKKDRKGSMKRDGERQAL